jgi:hypothetical protein
MSPVAPSTAMTRLNEVVTYSVSLTATAWLSWPSRTPNERFHAGLSDLPVLVVYVGVQEHVVRHIVWIQRRLEPIHTLRGDKSRGAQQRNSGSRYRNALEVHRLLHH